MKGFMSFNEFFSDFFFEFNEFSIIVYEFIIKKI